MLLGAKPLHRRRVSKVYRRLMTTARLSKFDPKQLLPDWVVQVVNIHHYFCMHFFLNNNSQTKAKWRFLKAKMASTFALRFVLETQYACTKNWQITKKRHEIYGKYEQRRPIPEWNHENNDSFVTQQWSSPAFKHYKININFPRVKKLSGRDTN